MKAAALLAVVLAAAALAAEWTGQRTAVYAGAVGGVLFGLVGYAFAAMIARRNRIERETGRAPGKRDIWSLWVGGVLARMAMLGVCAGALNFCLPDGWRVALLTLACVYLPLMIAETLWLMTRFVDSK